MMQLTIGTKGEIVIPKKMREYIGLSPGKKIIADIKEKTIFLRQPEEDIAKKWEERAKQAKVDVSKWVYGDKLYEEVF